MKTIHSFAVAVVAFLLQAALQVVALAQTPVLPPTATTTPARDVGATLATLSGTVNANGSSMNVKFQWGLTTDYGSETVLNITQANFTTPFAVLGKISGLTQNTTYHYRVSATNAGGTTNGDDASFTTPAAKLPNAFGVQVMANGPTSVTLSGMVTPNGSPTTARFQYRLDKANSDEIDVPVVPDPGFGFLGVPVKATVTGLTPGTAYRYRLIATNQAGTFTSSEMVSVTPALRVPLAITYPATTLGASTATLNAIVSFPIGQEGAAKFQYGLTADYGSEAAATVSTDGSAWAVVALAGLAPGTTYHYRIAATNDVGTKNGEDFTFTTLATDAPQPPYVGPTIASGVSYSVLSVHSPFRTVICPSGLPSTAKLQLGTTTNYGSETVVKLSPVDGTTLQKVQTPAIPLQPSTTYHCRFTATNAAGTTNGEDFTFTTEALLSAPIVGDVVPTVISSKAATIQSTVNPAGSPTSVYVDYGPTTSYGKSATANGYKSLSGFGAQPVTSSLGGLTPNTTYHCRVRAINDIGTTNGPDATFTTPAGDPTTPTSPGPWLTYEMRIDPATSSAGVTVTDVHHAVAGAAGDVVGVQIYAVVNSANSNHADDGFMLGEGSFVSTGALLGDLRGDIAGQPTTQVNNVAPFDLASIAQSGYQADLDSDGDLDIGSNLTASNAVLVFPWFVAWSDLNQGSIPILGSGSGTGPTEFLIGRTTFTVGVGAQLGQETTVKFQPRIRNDGAAPVKLTQQFTLDGLAVKLAGDDPNIALVDASIRLADAPVPQPPVAITGAAATEVGATAATLHASVNPGSAATTAAFQSGLTDAYGTETVVTLTPNDGHDPQDVSTTLTGLAANTTYHFRIHAMNSAGSADGADVTFTTLADAIPPTIAAPDGGFLPLTLTTGGDGTAPLPDYTTQAATGDNVGVTGVIQAPTPGPVSAGLAHVVLTAHDAAGNTADVAFDVTVLDGTAPVITHAPDSVSGIADDSGNALVPDVTGQVTATDNVGVAGITQAPAAGASAGVGQTNIVVTVSDAAGNTATAGVIYTVLAHAEPPSADRGRGYYSGLLDEGADGPDGLVTLFVSATGAMTGKVSFHGVTKGFQATFHNDTAQVGFAGGASLILARNPAGGIDLTFGDFSGHAENSPYSADSPAPMRGSYTVLLPPDPAHAGDAAFPQGTGFATLRVNQLGVVHGVGRVGDGGVLAFDSSVHGDGTLPCYDGLYTAPFGSIGGTLTFRDLAGSDLDGTLSWSKPTPSAVKVGHGALVGGFGNLRVPAIGSLYHPTATPLQMLNYSNTHRATVTFHDGGLTAPMSGTATVRQVLSAFVTPPMQSLVFSPEDGVISGALRSATANGAPRPFFGVVFQKQNRGAGLFKGTGATGGFDYTPQP